MRARRRIARRGRLGIGLALLAALACGCGQRNRSPIVVAGPARFEFLTPTLVRLEYAAGGAFVDAPTAVVQKRDWPAVTVATLRREGWLIASSGALTLRYKLDSGPFSAQNLELTWRTGPGARRWHPGDQDALNLGGLTYSLDNVSVDNLPPGLPARAGPVNDSIPGIDYVLPQPLPGLLSRAGYALLDDSRSPLWNADRTWIEPRQGAGQDWYFFAYGDDLQQPLTTYAQLCGPIPMVPRYVLGPMVTDFNFEYFPGSAESRDPRFRRYDQRYLQAELARLRASGIPFDTLVLDFAWHNYGWDGGYDWSPLFPHPQEFLAWLRARGIKLSLNDHPGYIHTDESILSLEDSHAGEVLHDLGRPVSVWPGFDLDISQRWTFAPDARDAGLEERWYEDPQRTRWRPIRIGTPWQEQGYGARIGWYRATLDLPAHLPPRLYLYLGAVRASYRLFVNGSEVQPSRIHWPQRLTHADLTRYIRPGQPNELVLRVAADERGGGILLAPVALRDVEPPPRIAFDLGNRREAEVSMRDLHGPLMDQGVDFWWVDGGSGATAMPGLNPQLWTNKVFYDFEQQHSGRRAFILGRYGEWGSERYPGFFTGDTYSQWPVLAYEVAFTARGGNVLVPYISHDIGGFHGARIDFDLYARWLEFGAFSPLLRMHSAHANPIEGNVRMPWLYGPRGVALMRKYFTARIQLLPYLYTYTYLAHRDALPLLRPLYLAYPSLEEAYHESHEYLLGESLLVAPVLDPSGDVTLWLPPGQWVDFFTGKRYDGDRRFSAHYAVDETPVFVRAGALIPQQEAGTASDSHPLDRLFLDVYPGAAGHFELYEDDGVTLDFDKGESALTPLSYSEGLDGAHTLHIAATRGAYQGQPRERTWQVRIHAAEAPSEVRINGHPADGWRWDARRGTAEVAVPSRSIREPVEIAWH